MNALSWRPGLRWLPLSVALGICAGALTGAAMMAVSALFSASVGTGSSLPGLFVFLLAGAVVGGVLGAYVGLVVGIPFVFLVGAHLPHRMARARAFALGVLLPPLALVAVLGAASSFEGLTDTLLLTPPVLASGVLGGPLAAWAASLDVTRLFTPPPAGA